MLKEKTKQLYGIDHEELQKIIGKEMLKAHYNIRIKLLKRNLHLRIEQSTTDPLVDKIANAIDFWEEMKDNI